MKTLLLLIIIAMAVMVTGKGFWKEASYAINQLFGTIVATTSNGGDIDIQLKQILLPWLITGVCCALLLILMFCSCIIIVKETLLRSLLEKKIILMRLDIMKQTEEYNRQIEQHRLQQENQNGDKDDIQRAIQHIVTASESIGKNPTALEQQDEHSSSVNNDSQTNLIATTSQSSISDIDSNNPSDSLVSEPISDSLVSLISEPSNRGDDTNPTEMSSSSSEASLNDSVIATTTVRKESHGHIEATVVARSNRRHSSLTSWQPGVNPIGGGATRKRSLDKKDSPLHTSITADTIRNRKSPTHSDDDSDSLTSVSTASTSLGSLSPSDEGSPVHEPIKDGDHQAGKDCHDCKDV